MRNSETFAAIPMRSIGPIRIIGPLLNEEIKAPLATFETPLWPSTQRGANISCLTQGIKVVLVNEIMTRSVLLEAPDCEYAQKVQSSLKNHQQKLEALVLETSRYCQLKDWHIAIVGKLLFIRFAMSTGEASGHNMTTKAADALLDWILAEYKALTYVSISGNYCTDKKTSAVNGILGRGKYMVAEITIPNPICKQYLKTTAEKIVNLNIKKNLIGSLIAGSVRTANAHFANMLLGFYLATGQDAANIIEGSQGIVHAEVIEENLYFSVTLPNIIVGSIGNGKHHPFVKENLEKMGCLEDTNLHDNNQANQMNQVNQVSRVTSSQRLAAIAAALVLCGELSLLSAQTNKGELMASHLSLERKQKSEKSRDRSDKSANKPADKSKALETLQATSLC